MRRSLLILALLSVVPAWADRPFPPPLLEESGNGRYYAILHRGGPTPGRLELCERRAGAPPIKSAPLILPAPDIQRDPRDRLIVTHEGGEAFAVATLRVLDRGPAVLVASEGPDRWISCLDARGRVRWRVDLNGQPPIRGPLFSAWWLDEAAGFVLFVRGPHAGPPGIRRLALAGGELTPGRAEDLLRGLALAGVRARAMASAAVLTYRPAGTEERLAGLIGDGSRPIEVRLSAAFTLHQLGQQSPRTPGLLTQALSPTRTPATRAWALRLVRILAPTQAEGVLKPILDRADDPLRSQARRLIEALRR